jgi:nucleotide-binding universal stress UspA family protein
MITRILLPTDFSPVANNALKYALSIAKKTGADLHLFHVDSIPVTDAYFPAGAYSAYMADIADATRESFEKLKAAFYKDDSVKFHSVSIMGYGPTEIINYAIENKIDLIIMGTTGSSGLPEILFGSNTAAVVSKSPLPVLVIPPSAQHHAFNKIVYATDYNEPEFPSVSRLVYLAGLYDAAVTVLHVRSEYDMYMKTHHNFFIKNKDSISYKNWAIAEINDSNVMDGINSFIEEAGPDLLVVAKHNRHFFERLFHRSLSKRMAYHSSIPLLVLNEDKTAPYEKNPEKESMDLSTINF